MENNSIPHNIVYSFAIQTGVGLTIGFALPQLSGSDIIVVNINCFILCRCL